MKRVQIYLTEQQIEKLQSIGARHDIIAVTGVKAGQPDRSAVIRRMIDYAIENEEKVLADATS